MKNKKIKIIGGGLAGCEASYQLAKRGYLVDLYEMKPNNFSPAHHNQSLAEVVCSNSFKSTLLSTASGVLKEELKIKNIDPLDIDLLTSIYSNVDTIIEMKESSIYSKVKQALLDTIEALNKNKEYALFSAQTDIIPNIKSKEEARLYLDLLSLLFKDIIRVKLNQDLSLQSLNSKIVSLSDKIVDPYSNYLEILLTRGKIELNVSISLLIEHIFITIQKGGKENGRK